MANYYLARGNVVMVIRKDQYGDPNYWLVCSVEQPVGNRRLYYTHAENCVPLDPALNILFERKDDDDKTGDSRRTG